MVQVLNPEQINEIQEKERQTEAAVEAAAIGPDQMLLSLASYVRQCWSEAQRAKVEVETQILTNMRQRRGVYEDTKLNAIKAMKSAETFLQLTGIKCRHAKDWVVDILFQPGTNPFDIKTTPIPEVPPWVENHVWAKILNARVSELFRGDAMVNPGMAQEIPFLIQQEMPAILERVKKEIIVEAKDIVEKMKQKIHDQLVEGNFFHALMDFIPNVMLHTGFIEGPIYRKVKTRKLIPDPQTGKVKVAYVDKILEEYESVSPLDIYPAPDSNGINNGYLFKKTSYTGTQLSSLIGAPGYSEDAIRSALREHGGGLREWTGIETQRATEENKSSFSTFDSTKIDCLVFYGDVQGRKLLEFGMSPEEIQDPEIFYPAQVWIIGNHVIKAMLNPDPLGRKNIYKCSFDEQEAGFWGRGLPQILKDPQEACNACARHAVNNTGMAAGPMIEIDKDRCPGAGEPAPGRMWFSTESQMASGLPAVRFYQVTFIADRLMDLIKSWLGIADELCGVPAFSHGGQDVQGAGDTASGLSMLMTSAARGIKGVLKAIDRNVIEPVVEMRYDHNIEQVENAALVGDLMIEASGASSLIAKEQQSIRRNEFLNTVASKGVLTQIVGYEGLKYLLKDSARAAELDPDKVVPDAQPQIPPADPGISPPGSLPAGAAPGQPPETLNAAAEPVSGQDFNLSQKGAIPANGP